MGIGELIVLIIVGAIVGALGRLISPGRDPMGWIMTIVIGVAAMLIAGFIFDGILQWIVGIIVAVLLVGLYARVMGDRGRPAAGRA